MNLFDNVMLWLYVFGILITWAIVIIWMLTENKRAEKRLKIINKNLQKNHRDIEVMKFLLQDDIIDKIDRLIDINIEMASNNYLDLTFGLRNIDDSYLTEEMQKEMEEYIYQSTMKGMTKEIRELISLVHRIDEEKDLEELIRFRIKMFMISLLIKTNK